MIRHVPSPLRLASFAALVLGLASVLRAQEKEGGAPAASNDAIAEAKRNFDGIKSAREAALLPGGQVPRVSLPELSLPPTTSPAAVVQKSKPTPREAKSANWLVDAMEKQSNSRDQQSLNSRGRDRNGRSSSREKEIAVEERDGRTISTDERGEKRDDDKRARADAEQDTASGGTNPLTAFLGEWMTPQDYALLKPGLASSPEMGVMSKTSGAQNQIGTGGSIGGTTEFSFGGVGGAIAKLPPPSRENPYLQSLKPELPIGPIMTGSKPTVSPSVQVSTAPVAIAAPPPLVQPVSKIPEFAKPPVDDRYFKQLKRF